MAIESTLINRKLLLSINNGDSSKTSRSYNNLNPAATAEDIHATAMALASLMDKTVASVYYDDKTLLTEVEAD